MKKIISVIFAVALLIPAASLAVSAAGNIVGEWLENGYPSDVGGAYFYTAGYDPTVDSDPDYTTHYCIYVLKGTSDTRKAEIASLCGTKNVQFVECTYSYDQLSAYYRAITRDLSSRGLLYEYEYGEEHPVTLRKDDAQITIYAKSNTENEVKTYIEEKYPELLTHANVELNFGIDPAELSMRTGVAELGGIKRIAPDDDGTVFAYAENDPAKYIPMIVAALLLFTAMTVFIVLRARKSRTLSLSNGDTVSTGTPSAREVKNMVRSSNPAPSEHVLDDILKS